MSLPVAIIPAAGASSRMGRPKPLLRWNGGTILTYILEQLQQVGFVERIVVVGADYSAIEAEALTGGAIVARNEGWEEGRASSIRVGASVCPETADPILVMSVDQPRPAWLLHQLLAAYSAQPVDVLVPAHAGRRGHPVLFAGACLPELRSVSDEELGLRAIMKRHEAGLREIPIASPVIHVDLNTPEAYEDALHELSAGVWTAPAGAEGE